MEENPILVNDSDIDSILDTEFGGLETKTVVPEGVVTPNLAKVVDTMSTESAEVTPTEVTPQIEAPGDDQNHSVKVPIKGTNETDESFAVRLEIARMIKQKEDAASDSEKGEIQQELKKFRNEFGHLISNNRSQLSINDNGTPSEPINQTDPDPDPVKTVDDIEAIIDQRLAEKENRNVTKNFFDKYQEFTDPNIKQVFIEFFDNNYKLDGKNGNQILQTLELARGAMFKKDTSINERVVKAALGQEKVNAMQFPGGTVVQSALTHEQQKSLEELKATGMSEDDARIYVLD